MPPHISLPTTLQSHREIDCQGWVSVLGLTNLSHERDLHCGCHSLFNEISTAYVVVIILLNERDNRCTGGTHNRLFRPLLAFATFILNLSVGRGEETVRELTLVLLVPGVVTTMFVVGAILRRSLMIASTVDAAGGICRR